MTLVRALQPPPEAPLQVARVLHTAGFEAWFVGGCVRDRLLGREVGDWDLTTNARPDQVIPLFARTIPTGIAHGTVTVVLGGSSIEVTTYRVELGYSDGRRPDGVAFTDDLRRDLERRDFTINAMAWDPDRGLLVDPFGGQADLADRCLRAVGRAFDRFSEDGLRTLRAIRFATVLDFDIEPLTFAAIRETLAVFRQVSAERIHVELVKILGSPHAGRGLSWLIESGLLEEFLPGLPLEASSIADALRVSAPSLTVRCALLFGELRDPAAGLTRLKFSLAQRRDILAVLASREIDPEAVITDADARRFVAKVGKENLDAIEGYQAALSADQTAWSGLFGRLSRCGARDAPVTARELALTGHDVLSRLALPPSREVGRIVQALIERVLEAPELNDAETLAALLPEVAASLRPDER